MNATHPPISTELVVRAYINPPDFAAERAFIRTERQYVARQIEAAERGSWLDRAARRSLGRTPRARDWRHYDQALTQYSHKLDQHERDIATGLTPVTLILQAQGAHAYRHVHIRIMVHDGRVQPHTKAPERPTAVDRGEQIHWSWFWPSGRFWRSGIRLTAHAVEATLSRIAAGESVAVVNQTVYIKAGETTMLTYELSSPDLPHPVQAEAEVYG